MKIEHQQQPTGSTCMSACIAMVLGEPVSDIVSDFHKSYMAEKLDADEYLRARGIELEVLLTNAKIEAGYIYICSVPSLNLQARTHAILLDMREEYWSLYDPNQGKEGKLYYVPDVPDSILGENEVRLVTAAPDIRIL